MEGQGVYDPYVQSNRYAYPTADHQSLSTPTVSDPPLSAADQYRLQYANVPFYGDTTHRSAYQPIELPRDTTSQSLYADDGQFSQGAHDSYADSASRQATEDALDNRATNALDPDDSISNREKSNISDYSYADVPFYGDTTYRTTYTPLVPRENFAPNRQPGPPQNHYADVPFYGDTTNRTHFTGKTTDRVTSFRRPDQVPYGQERPSSSSSTITTHRSEYGPKQGERSTSFKPQHRSILTSAASAPDLDTISRAEYTPKQGERTKNQKPRDEWLPKDDNFGDQSTHRSEYTPKKIEKVPNYKPKGGQLWNGEAFDDRTTNRSVYSPKELSGRRVTFRPKQSRLSLPEDVPLENQTTNRSNYGPKPLAPRPDAFRPKLLNLGTGERMDNETVSRAEYVPKQAERAKAYKPTTTVALTEGPMQATTVSGEDYKPWQVQKVASFKPGHTRVWSQPFDGKTTNRETYIPKEADMCPAELLLRNKSDFRHVFDRGGHRYYQKITTHNEVFTRDGLQKRRSSLGHHENAYNLLRESTRAMLLG